MSTLSRRTMLKSLAASGLLLAGGTSVASARNAGAAPGKARFRVGHFSPDTAPVDVFVDDAPFPGLQGVPFGVLSEYFVVPAGTYNVKVALASDNDTVAIDADLTLRRNRDYTVLATGFFVPTPVVLVDTNVPAPAKKARVRVGHYSPDAPAVDIVVKDGPTLLSEFEFGDVSEYLKLPMGTYDLQVRLSSDGSLVQDIPGVKLMGGTTYSVFAIGSVGGQGEAFTVLPVVDSKSPARQRPPASGQCRVR